MDLQLQGAPRMTRGRLAVLVTAHNRKAETVACMERIRSQRLQDNVQVHVILVDDGSTDGTAAAVREKFRDIDVIAGTGGLYWNGGMRVAFERALREDYDFYLLLNDDTHLEPHAIETMLRTYELVARSDRPDSIVVGSTRDPRSGALSYGGWRTVRRSHPTKCVRVEPCEEPQPCDTMNANCALIPRSVVARIGSLDPRFTHGMGDWDYGFRAKRARCGLWVAPGYVGTCAANSGSGSWTAPGLGVGVRWRRLIGPKGLPPLEWLVFTRRHAGPFWLLYFVSPYVKFWWRAGMRGVLRGHRHG